MYPETFQSPGAARVVSSVVKTLAKTLLLLAIIHSYSFLNKKISHFFR